MLAWLAWTLGAAVAAFMTRNPLYLAIIALSAWLVYVTAGQRSGLERSWRGLLKVGAMIWLLAIPFNALMMHQGKHILFSLPKGWPLVGGPITLEAVAAGAASGFALWVLLLIFSAFNTTVDASQLLRLTPAFLYQAGVITSIALTFMPQMLLSLRDIREAQRLRGHRFRTWRDLLPLVMPLLTTAFEHAAQLAESMESRGFGGQLTGLPGKTMNRLRWQMLGGLGALLAGLFFYTYRQSTRALGVGLIAVAALALIYVFQTLGEHIQRSHYRRILWRRSDTVIVILSIAVFIGILLVRAADKLALVYYPYPPYALAPEFNPWIGLLLALLAAPGVIALFAEPVGADVSVEFETP